jgi:hypothetical protein
MGIADSKHIAVALNAFHKGARAQNNKAKESEGMSMEDLEALIDGGDLGPAVRESVERAAKIASFCKTAEAAENTEVPETAEPGPLNAVPGADVLKPPPVLRVNLDL